VLGVGDRVADDVLELVRPSARDRLEGVGRLTHEDLENTTGLLVDETRDTLDTTTTRETADGGLGDTPEARSAVAQSQNRPRGDVAVSECRGDRAQWMNKGPPLTGCCHARPSCDAWHRPCRDPCHLDASAARHDTPGEPGESITVEMVTVKGNVRSPLPRPDIVN
jgi:hypothetical protein